MAALYGLDNPRGKRSFAVDEHDGFARFDPQDVPSMMKLWPFKDNGGFRKELIGSNKKMKVCHDEEITPL